MYDARTSAMEGGLTGLLNKSKNKMKFKTEEKKLEHVKEMYFQQNNSTTG
jgi:hypothetical protein